MLLLTLCRPVAAETIRLSAFKRIPFSDVVAHIMTEAYRRIGYKAEIIYMSER